MFTSGKWRWCINHGSEGLLWAVLDEGAAHNLDSGHWIQQEKPEETTRAILDWLAVQQAA